MAFSEGQLKCLNNKVYNIRVGSLPLYYVLPNIKHKQICFNTWENKLESGKLDSKKVLLLSRKSTLTWLCALMSREVTQNGALRMHGSMISFLLRGFLRCPEWCLKQIWSDLCMKHSELINLFYCFFQVASYT